MPSRSRVTNNNTYVLHGFSSLSSLLSESFSQHEVVEGLDDALAKARISPCTEQKATRYSYKMRKVVDEKKRAEGEGIEGTELEDPLKFWLLQVKPHS